MIDADMDEETVYTVTSRASSSFLDLPDDLKKSMRQMEANGAYEDDNDGTPNKKKTLICDGLLCDGAKCIIS